MSVTYKSKTLWHEVMIANRSDRLLIESSMNYTKEPLPDAGQLEVEQLKADYKLSKLKRDSLKKEILGSRYDLIFS